MPFLFYNHRFLAKYEFSYQKTPKRIFGEIELTTEETKYQQWLLDHVKAGNYKGPSL